MVTMLLPIRAFIRHRREIFIFIISFTLSFGLFKIYDRSYQKLADDHTDMFDVPLKVIKSPPSIPESLANCTTRVQQKSKQIHGKFIILANFIIAERQVNCRDYVTYTTHGDFRYLENLVTLVKRWNAPISLAIYTPSADLQPTLYRIAYLRQCTTELIRRWVSFHLFSESEFFKDPAVFLGQLEAKGKDSGICHDTPAFAKELINTPRKGNQVYPINVARNIARREATTHFVLASDIELYPSGDLNRKFVELLYREESQFKSVQNPFVFVLPVFEVSNRTVEIPKTKNQLVRLMAKNMAGVFHEGHCGPCHQVPKFRHWIRNTSFVEDVSLNVFHVAKRTYGYGRWEPIYIGTNLDPFYDEELSWEGLSDKMNQAYAMCLLNYDFMILDNAFLVHKAFKANKSELLKPHPKMLKMRNNYLSKKLREHLRHLHGNRPECGFSYFRRNNTTHVSPTNSTIEMNVTLFAVTVMVQTPVLQISDTSAIVPKSNKSFRGPKRSRSVSHLKKNAKVN